MSKIKVLHGGGVRCDVVHVRETATEIVHENDCKSMFVTYSLPSMARKQAEAAGWLRTKVRYVTWSGDPPDTPKKKVDICPSHASLVVTPEEYKRRKKEAREAAKKAKETEVVTCGYEPCDNGPCLHPKEHAERERHAQDAG